MQQKVSVPLYIMYVVYVSMKTHKKKQLLFLFPVLILIIFVVLSEHVPISSPPFNRDPLPHHLSLPPPPVQ